jgi:hypothetical protein
MQAAIYLNSLSDNMAHAMNFITDIASHFAPKDSAAAVEDCRAGNINDTFIVRLNDGHAENNRIVIQCVNNNVFADPSAIVKNGGLVSKHITNKTPVGTRLVPTAVPTRTGTFNFVDDLGQVWRAWAFLAGEPSTPPVSTTQATCMGRTLARFHQALLDFDHRLLANTLPSFHEFSPRVKAFQGALRASSPARRLPAAVAIEQMVQYISLVRPVWAAIEDQAYSHPRVIHGDSKADNMLYDKSCHTCSLVDLDTVMTGSVLVDFGDLARSAGATVSENEVAAPGEGANLATLYALYEGYLPIARDYEAYSERGQNRLAITACQ